MEFSREELRVILHALNLATLYYEDPDRRVKGMHPPSPETVKSRLAALEPVTDRIVRWANEVL